MTTTLIDVLRVQDLMLTWLVQKSSELFHHFNDNTKQL